MSYTRGGLSFFSGAAASRNGKGRPSVTFDLRIGALPVGIALSRASAAQYRDASGVWTAAAVDAPRFSYRWNGAAWVMGGLLIEAAATNLALYSQNFTPVTWTKSNVTATATQILETATFTDHRINQSISFVNANSYCMSAEASEISTSPKRYMVLLFPTAVFGGVLRYAKYDLATGVVVFAASGVTAGIEAAGPSKWLCWISSVSAADAVGTAQVRIDNTSGSGLPTYTGDTAAGLNVSEIQVEIGTRPTSRIPTTTEPVARAADAVTVNWGSRGVADGAITVRYVFADGTAQQVASAIAAGLSAIPTPLNRSTVDRIEEV